MNEFDELAFKLIAEMKQDTPSSTAIKAAQALKELRSEKENLRASLAAAEKTVHDISVKAINQGDKLYRENEALRTRLVAADSLIAEMKQRGTQDDQARKEAAVAVTAERDQLLVDLENARAQAEVYRKLCTRFSARYDELRDDIIKHYSDALGVQERFPSHASCRDSITRLAKYAKVGAALHKAMSDIK